MSEDLQLSIRRVARLLRPLLPLPEQPHPDAAKVERLAHTRHLTLLTAHRQHPRALVFAYLLATRQFYHTACYTAEFLKDVYMGNHAEYSSLSALSSPNTVLLLGDELYNKAMVTILNVYIEQALADPGTKNLVLVYPGLVAEYRRLYHGERGTLQAGTLVCLSRTPGRSAGPGLPSGGTDYDVLV